MLNCLNWRRDNPHYKCLQHTCNKWMFASDDCEKRELLQNWIRQQSSDRFQVRQSPRLRSRWGADGLWTEVAFTRTPGVEAVTTDRRPPAPPLTAGHGASDTLGVHWDSPTRAPDYDRPTVGAAASQAESTGHGTVRRTMRHAQIQLSSPQRDFKSPASHCHLRVARRGGPRTRKASDSSATARGN